MAHLVQKSNPDVGTYHVAIDSDEFSEMHFFVNTAFNAIGVVYCGNRLIFRTQVYTREQVDMLISHPFELVKIVKIDEGEQMFPYELELIH